MSDSRLWLVNTNGNVFTLSTKHRRLRQLVKTYLDGVKLKRLAACQSGAWGIGHDHHVYIFVHSTEVPIRVQETTYENQRWSPISGFSGSNLLPTDRTNWSDEHGNGFLPKESFSLPSQHWEWDGDWEIDDNFQGQIASRGGWQYATNFPRPWTPESTWKSCVRKRKWIRFRRFNATDVWAKIFDEKMKESGDCFIDIAVGGFDIPTQAKGHLCVWGVTHTGQVYVRQGVTNDCPEGKEWRPISTDNHGLINISVGPTGLVWGVTWDGQCLVRLGVNRDHVYGTCWTLVTYPDESTRVMQIALGLNTLWALSREGKVWYRKGIQGTQLLTGTAAATGSTWVEMVGEMAHIAVTPSNQVFAVGLNEYEVYFRSGVTSSDFGGKTWQLLSLKENTAVLQHDSCSSVTSDSIAESGLEGSNRYSSSAASHMTRYMRTGSESGWSEGSSVRGSLTLATPIKQPARDEPSGEGRGLCMTLATPIQKTSSEQAVYAVLPTSHASGMDAEISNKAGENKSVIQDCSSNNGVTMETESSSTEDIARNKCDQETPCDKVDVCSAISPVQVSITSTDLETSESNLDNHQPGALSPASVSCKLSPKSVISSCDNFDSLGSSVTSEENDGIINFVTDLLSGSSVTETSDDADSKDVSSEDVSKRLEQDNMSDLQDTREITHTPHRPSSLEVVGNSSLLIHDSESPVFNQEESTPWTTIGPSTGISGTISVRSTPSIDQDVITMFEMAPAMPRYCWAWLNGMACVFDDPSKITWLQSYQESDDATPQGNKTKVKISLALRDDFLKKLHIRNTREVENFKFIESAVQRTSWLKKSNMKWYMFGKRPQWLDCSVELEQGHGDTEEGSLTIHYAFKGKPMHSQICIQDIVCVKQVSDYLERTTVVLHTTDTVKSLQPWLLKLTSESEVEDWVSLLCTVNAMRWKLNQPVPQGSVWSTTKRGDIFVHPPDKVHVKGHEMRWMQQGGHLKLLETSLCGITWGIGYDHSVWTNTGGYGGGIFKATSHLSKEVFLQTDMRTVLVYENQKWLPVFGYSSRGVVMEGYSWSDKMSQRHDSKEEVQLPSSRWKWVSDWRVDYEVEGGADNNGWQHASSFQRPFHQGQGMRDGVRRRKWTRKCKLETVGPWQPCVSVPLIDVSVQVEPVMSSSEPVVLWAVGTNGNVLTRLGVTMENPQGDSWIPVATDQPFRAVSVGGTYRVWALAMDGSAWYRPGVTKYNIAGTCWLQVVPPPPPGCLLKHISVGTTAVWAVDTRGNLWYRQEITETFPEGTRWGYVSNSVKFVSVGPQDQVWIVTDSNFMKNKRGPGVIYRRVGISDVCPTGTSWEIVIGSGWEYVSIRGQYEPEEEPEDLPIKEPL
ncbi:tectonin beta-propeller repeat-containing protein 1-like [Haliotis rufescens]|uniref:tectonin beta-propeller repeat-containing protein 1-like n=1 Tax=Haliotis rufescens TaxID=6454 RepID=UPI00201EAE71|nr:tectonin beta-propeller repeat-containing protein 1-like [Haliotis rufescens]XP_046351316.2 tectonin beta-propeller repeat-containing protein 1-like [Haliotis rufescens]